METVVVEGTEFEIRKLPDGRTQAWANNKLVTSTYLNEAIVDRIHAAIAYHKL